MQLYFWRKKELVPFIPKGKKARLSFANVIWLRMLDLMRQFNCPVVQMKEVCDYFFEDAYRDKLPEKNLKSNLDFYRRKQVAGTLDFDEIQNLRYLEEMQHDEELLYVLKKDINYLTKMILDCLDEGTDGQILIFIDGRVGELVGANYSSHRSGVVIDPEEPHIRISLLHLLRDFIKNEHLSERFVPQVLNEYERMVLRELKAKNLQTLTITMRDGVPMRFDTTVSGRISDAEADRIREILGLKNYEGIELTTRNQKELSFKRTRKHLIKDSD